MQFSLPARKRVASSCTCLCRYYSSKTPVSSEQQNGNELTEGSVSSREEKAQRLLSEMNTKGLEKAANDLLRISPSKQSFYSKFIPMIRKMSVDMKARAEKVSRWFGDNGNVHYVQDMSSTPEVNKTLPHRRFLDQTENAASDSSSYVERQQSATNLRMRKAKEDVSNYRRPDAHRVADTFRPKTLEEYAAAAESHMMSNLLRDYKPDGKPLESLKQESPHIDSHTYHLHKMMKRQGILPRWIELNKEITYEMANLKDLVLKIRIKWKSDLNEGRIAFDTPFRKYNNFILATSVLQEEVVQINRLILDYNLIVPNINSQKFGLFLEDIVKELEGEEEETPKLPEPVEKSES